MDRDFRQRLHRHRRASGAFVGVIIILIGTVMLLDTLGLIRGRDVWQFVPALIIALGLIKMFEARGRIGGTVVGLMIAGGGTLWLLDSMQIITFNPAMIWPLILIGVGVSMLVRRFDIIRMEEQGACRPGWTSDGAPLVVFGGSKRSVNSDDFPGTDALAIFGGVDLDLRPCKMVRPQAVVDANAIFGGVEIQVPPEWNVVMRGTAIFGGFGDNTAHPPQGAPELVITGVAIFGGINVKN